MNCSESVYLIQSHLLFVNFHFDCLYLFCTVVLEKDIHQRFPLTCHIAQHFNTESHCYPAIIDKKERVTELMLI